MEYNNLIDTSLSLTSTPYKDLLDHMEQEMQSNKDGIESKIRPKTEQVNDLVEELNSANVENQRLTEMLAVMSQNYNVLTNQMKEYVTKTDKTDINIGSRKRKSYQNITTNHLNNCDINNSIGGSSSGDEENFSCKKAKGDFSKANISRVCVRTQTSDTRLIVNDGYQWRKYGQKMTRDNPCPRAYFICSFAPSCPVKKKVQRSNEDQSMLVAIYEGEHNHPQSSNVEGKQSSSRSVTACSTSSCSSKKTAMTLDPTEPISQENEVKYSNKKEVNSHELQQFLVDQMALSLTRDPSFRESIAKAISSGRLLISKLVINNTPSIPL
ncbi:hypothetical protein Leryth_006032 [Lithospermum erythrorhizon]|nr:hypothetical protein Leryth_006032 [Lithospermum erythrorhizon]